MVALGPHGASLCPGQAAQSLKNWRAMRLGVPSISPGLHQKGRAHGSPRVCGEGAHISQLLLSAQFPRTCFIYCGSLFLWERKFPFNIFEKEICDSLASNKYCIGERQSIFTISLAYHQITLRGNCRYFSYILLC